MTRIVAIVSVDNKTHTYPIDVPLNKHEDDMMLQLFRSAKTLHPNWTSVSLTIRLDEGSGL